MPVVASRNGGIPESLLEGETGVLLPPGDVAAWADAIASLAHDQAGRQRMGQAGRLLMEQRFSQARIAADFERLLTESPA